MKILFWGLLFFLAAFFLHLLIWKVHMPKIQRKALLIIFLSTLIVGLCILSLIAPWTITDCLHIILFYLSISIAYIVTYSGIEVDSPTLVMTMRIAKAHPDGLPKAAFEQAMTNDILVAPRIKDLINDGRIYLDGNKYRLTEKGISLVRIFVLYRRLMNAPKGG